MSRNVYNNSSSSSSSQQYADYLAEPVSTYSPQTSPIPTSNDSASEDSHFPSSSATLHANSPNTNQSARPRQSFETTETSNWSAADSSYSNSQNHHSGAAYDQQQQGQQVKNPFTDSGRAGDGGIKHRGVPSTQSRGSFASWNGSASSLLPPNAPFAGSPSSPRPLSVHYLPSKFSTPHKQGQWAHRRAKVGGGRAAFGRHEARMPDEGPDDGSGKEKRPKLLWNRFKWMIFVANTVLILYSLIGLVCILLVWFNVWKHADIIRVGSSEALIVSTVALGVCLVTALIGYAGILLNNRSFLAVYSVLLWVCFALVLTPGYITYKAWAFSLEGHTNRQWSRYLGENGRLRIQNQLKCCGYYSPFVEATVSATCYSRASIPGCKGPFLDFQDMLLKRWFIVSFALIPVQIAIIIIALLSSNHVTYRFGKGLTPKQYRLDLGSLAFIMDGYAGEIAAAYGPTLAAEAIHRSSSNLELLQYSSHPGQSSDSSRRQSGYNSPKGSGSRSGSPYGTPFNQSRTSMAGMGGGGQEGGEYAMSGLRGEGGQQGQGGWDESDGEETVQGSGGAGGKKKKWLIGGRK